MNTFQTLLTEVNNVLTANLEKAQQTTWHSMAKTLEELNASALTSCVDRHYFPNIVNDILKTMFPNQQITFTHDRNNSFFLYFSHANVLKDFGFKVPPNNNRTTGYHFPVLFSVKKTKVNFSGKYGRPEAILVIKELVLDDKEFLTLTPAEFMTKCAKTYNDKLSAENNKLDTTTELFNTKLSSFNMTKEQFEELKDIEAQIKFLSR